MKTIDSYPDTHTQNNEDSDRDTEEYEMSREISMEEYHRVREDSLYSI